MADANSFVKLRRSARLASSLLNLPAAPTPIKIKRGPKEVTVSRKKQTNSSTRSPQRNINEITTAQLTVETKKKESIKRRRKENENSATKLETKKGKLTTQVKAEQQENRPEVNDLEKLVGAHVSISGGMENAVKEAAAIGASSFAMFLRSQRQWKSKPLDDNTAALFRDACKDAGFSPNSILPHGIYLMNCGSPDEETLAKSRVTLVDELQRCEKLGLCLYNFHPGSTCGKISVEECLDRIAESINQAHKETKYVVTVIENMSCQGNTIGGKFEELGGIIDRVKDKTRVGICLDTCHAFAAGYDLTTNEGFSQMTDEFDRVVGFKYLKGMHLNDSKGDCGCHLDRHENIGKGKIGLDGFKRVMREPRFSGIPMILETPCVSDSTYAREIKLLHSMMS